MGDPEQKEVLLADDYSWVPPTKWDENDFEGLCAAIKADVSGLQGQHPGKSTSLSRLMFVRTVRGWSYTVTRHVTAILTLLPDDVSTPYALLRQLGDSTENLRLLLLEYPTQEQREQAAIRALLFQAYDRYWKGEKDEAWKELDWEAVLENIETLEGLTDAETAEQVKRLAKNPISGHWTGLDAADRRAKSRIDPGDSIYRPLLNVHTHAAVDLYELEEIHLDTDVFDFTPLRSPDPETITIWGLWIWFYLRATKDAAERLLRASVENNSIT